MPGTKKKRRTSGEQGEAESTPQQGRSSGRPGERTAPPERGAGPTGLRGLTHTKPSKEVCLANDPRLRETPQSLRDSSPFRRSSTFIITGQRTCHRCSPCKAGRPPPRFNPPPCPARPRFCAEKREKWPFYRNFYRNAPPPARLSLILHPIQNELIYSLFKRK